MTEYATLNHCDHNQCVKRRNPYHAGLDMTAKLLYIRINEIDEDVLINERYAVGSVAEFSIDPLLSTVGDVDVVVQKTEHIGCFDELTKHMLYRMIEKYMYCLHILNNIWEIVPDVRFPAYVRVRPLVHIRLKDNKTVLYSLIESPREYLSASMSKRTINKRMSHIRSVLRGPAVKIYYNKGKSSLSNTLIHSQDIVSPIRCFAWPPAAMEWKTRQRKHGWPDERTIALVVESGCDVVPVAHNDNRMDEYQWRISFSKAEVILMNSLTPGQQYIYHML